MNPTVREIVKYYLKGMGFDGLLSPGSCGCQTDDLIPCDDNCADCIPGYKGPDPSGEYDFKIYESKTEAEKANAKCPGRPNPNTDNLPPKETP